MRNPLSIITLLLLSYLMYFLHQYYNDVELVEILPQQGKVKMCGGAGLGYDYSINYKGKEYKRKYKFWGISNLLWDSDDLLDNNRWISEEPIYFYCLKSDKNLQETSRYFLPSANKPITNKIILILDIWGYFMTNWFWRILLGLGSVIAIEEFIVKKENIKYKNKFKLFYKIDTFCLKFLAIIYISILLCLFFY